MLFPHTSTFLDESWERSNYSETRQLTQARVTAYHAGSADTKFQIIRAHRWTILMINSMLPLIFFPVSLVLGDSSLLNCLLTALSKANVYLSYCHFSLSPYRLSYKYRSPFATFTPSALPPI